MRSALNHIEKRHGENGSADNTMKDLNDVSRIGYVLDNGTVYVSECIPDSVNKRIYITSAYIKKGSTDQLLNMDSEGSPQPTPEASFDGSATNSSISQDGTNVNSKISTDLSRYAELAGMGENGVQLMQEVYDGKMSPEKFFEAYNRVYATGKSRGEARRRDVALLGENVAAMARNAGEMDALKASGTKAKISQTGLSNDTSSGTIESTQSRRENSDGKENESGLLSGNTVSDGGGYSKISSQGKGTSGDVDSSRVHGESGRVGVLSEDSEGRRISSDTLSKQSRRENSDGKVDNGGDGRRSSSKHAQEQVVEGSRGVQMADRNSSQSGVDTRAGGKRVLDTDSEGVRVQVEILDQIADTAIVDEQGHPIAVYHATDANFDVFNKGDIGFHFGNTEQAAKRANDKKIDSPKYIRAYLNIKNPIISTRDTMSWNTRATTLNLWSMGILSDSERAAIEKLDINKSDEYNSPAAIKLREILESKGYDGIAYPNGFEGEGTSYIAFHDEQIVRVDNGDTSGDQSSDGADPDVQQAKENAIDNERVVYSSNKAMAYDAIPRDKLDTKQKKVVDVAAQIGRKVIFAVTTNADGVEVDGFIAKNGDIYINPNKNVAPMTFVFKHELAHFAERAGQKYRDFKDAVTRSATFKDWLKRKGFNSLREYNAQIRAERASIGQKLDEPEATVEIISNFVGDMLFTDQGTWAEDLVRELGPKQRKTVREYIRDFFSWIKSKFVGDAGKAKVEVRKLEKAFGAAFRAAVESNAGTNGEQFSFQGYAKDGKGKYKSNFPKGTPKSAKAKVILDYIKNVWSKKPIALQINENGKTRTIQAQFDPTYDETENVNTDASKLMGGNRHGTSSDQRVTLDLADDYYQIAAESTYNYSKDETGKNNPTHKDVKKWHYFINDIYFAEYDSDNYVPYRVTINIKEKADGTFVYSFSAENQERLNTPRTLHAVVKGDEVTPNVQPSNISISNSDEKNNSQNAQNFEDQTEQFSYTPQNDKVTDIFERIRSGELSLNDAEQLLKKPEGDTPASIASLKPEDMGTTPRVSKKTNGNAGDGDSRFAGSVQRSSIFDEDFKKEVGDDNFVKHYASITNKETLAEAAKRLDEGGEAYVTDWLSKKAVHMDTVDTMVGFILLKRYQDIGDYSSAAAVAQKVREVGTLSGQRVQAFSIIGRFDADMMQTYAQRELDKAVAKEDERYYGGIRGR